MRTILGLIGFIPFLMVGCDGKSVTGCTEPQAPNFENRASRSCNNCCLVRVEYEVTGDFRDADITYTDASGNKQQLEDVGPGWNHYMELRPGIPLSLFGQIDGEGDIKVSIYENNSLFKASFSSGQAAKAEAKGAVPSYK